MENTYTTPYVNPVSVMPKPKNYFIIALIITLAAYIFDGLSNMLLPSLTSLIDHYLAQNIISNLLYLMSDIVEFAIVFFGFILITKNKIAAFRFSGTYFFGLFAVGEFASVIRMVIMTITYSNGYYGVYDIFNIILGLFTFILVVGLVPLCFNIINSRKVNQTINSYQKKGIQIRAIVGICAIQLLSLTSIIHPIWNMVSGVSMVGWMVMSLIRFFFLLIFVAVISVYANSFRKDARDIIALFAMILFPRIITFLAGDLMDIIFGVINSFVHSGIVSIIASALNILVSLGVSIVVVNFTLKKFFPVADNIPAGNNFSGGNNFSAVASNPVSAPPVFTSPSSKISSSADDFDATVRQ